MYLNPFLHHWKREKDQCYKLVNWKTSWLQINTGSLESTTFSINPQSPDQLYFWSARLEVKIHEIMIHECSSFSKRGTKLQSINMTRLNLHGVSPCSNRPLVCWIASGGTILCWFYRIIHIFNPPWKPRSAIFSKSRPNRLASRHLWTKPHKGKYDIRYKKLPALYLQAVLSTAGSGFTNRMQVSKMFMVNVLFCRSKKTKCLET